MSCRQLLHRIYVDGAEKLGLDYSLVDLLSLVLEEVARFRQPPEDLWGFDKFFRLLVDHAGEVDKIRVFRVFPLSWRSRLFIFILKVLEFRLTVALRDDVQTRGVGFFLFLDDAVQLRPKVGAVATIRSEMP